MKIMGEGFAVGFGLRWLLLLISWRLIFFRGMDRVGLLLLPRLRSLKLLVSLINGKAQHILIILAFKNIISLRINIDQHLIGNFRPFSQPFLQVVL
jgi:hypothetical protein